jgi:hypothetical protein
MSEYRFQNRKWYLRPIAILAAVRFNRRFRCVAPGISPKETINQIGIPDREERSIIPENSAVGLQEGFKFKLAPGDPYLEWRYDRAGMTYWLWFAFDPATDDWRLSWSVRLPSIIDSMDTD